MEPIKHNFLTLPTDIHKLYFDLLDEDGLHRASQVCKRYKILSEDYFLKFFKTPFLEADLSKPLKPQLALHYYKCHATLLPEIDSEEEALGKSNVFRKQRIIKELIKINLNNHILKVFKQIFILPVPLDEQILQCLLEIKGGVPEQAIVVQGRPYSPLNIALSKGSSDHTIKIIAHFIEDATSVFPFCLEPYKYTEEIILMLLKKTRVVQVATLMAALRFPQSRENVISRMIEKLEPEDSPQLHPAFKELLKAYASGRYSDSVIQQFRAKFPKVHSFVASELHNYITHQVIMATNDYFLRLVEVAEKPFEPTLIDLCLHHRHGEKVVNAVLTHTYLPNNVDPVYYFVYLTRLALINKCSDDVILTITNRFHTIPHHLIDEALLMDRSPALIKQLKARTQSTCPLF